MSTIQRPARRVLLVGWDAADWAVASPLMDAGQMPALQSIVEGGVMGNLATLRPMLSPMMWTSIATGVRPHKHGILGFTEPDLAHGGIRPVSSTTRKRKALWNMLHQSGLTSNVVGWWPSHPVEPIRGVMVSNRFQEAKGPLDAPWQMAPATVHPARLAPALEPLRIHPEELPGEVLDSFVPLGRSIDQSKDRRLYSCARLLAECSSIHAAATAVMQNEPWDFMAVYYDAIDHFGHGFMKYHPPRRPHIDARDFELYKHVVTAAYRYHDMMLATLLKLAGEDTTVIVVSDHGFHPDHLRPEVIPDEPAGPAVEHSPYGIFAMKGPGIRRDERIHGASLLDVAPTVLSLFGLPIGRDFDGKPLVQAFEQPPAIQAIDSWETLPGDAGSHPPDLRLDPVDSREAVRQLVDLGYVDDPGDDKDRAADQATRELQYNLSQCYIDAELWPQALPLLEQLWAEHPDELRFGRLLAETQHRMGRLPEFRASLDALAQGRERLARSATEALQAWQARVAPRRLDDREFVATLGRQAQQELRRLHLRAAATPAAELPLRIALLMAERREAEALGLLRDLQAAGRHHHPLLHRSIGQMLGRLRQPAEAEQAFRQAIALNPRDAQSHHGLAAACHAQGRHDDAIQAALTAVGLLYHYPLAHLQLARSLAARGRHQAAADACQVALRQAPGLVPARMLLARLYRDQLGQPGPAAAQLALALQARQQARVQGQATGQKPSQAEARDSAPQQQPSEPAAGPAALPSALAATTIRHDQPEPALAAPQDAARIVTVVSGLPRSGTSMLMQMLAAAGLAVQTDAGRAADEDNPHGYFEDERVKRLGQDAAWMAQAQGKVIKVVAPLIPFLPPGLQYRVVMMERDLDELLDSQATMLQRRGRAGARLTRERLKASYAQQLAHAQAVLRARGVPCLMLAYREVMADPAAAAERLAAFLGGALDTAAMRGAVDGRLGRHSRLRSAA